MLQIGEGYVARAIFALGGGEDTENISLLITCFDNKLIEICIIDRSIVRALLSKAVT